jgi:hypothetical protein
MTEEAYESALRQALNELAEVDKQAEDIERKRAKLRQSVAVLQTLAGDNREQERSVTKSIVTILRANPGPLPTVQIIQRLISMGHTPQPASVATLLSRLAQQGKITKADDGYEWRKNMLPRPSPEGSHQMDAFVQRFSKAVCFFIAPVPTDGSASPATALLVLFKDQKYLVTALHNFFHDLGGKEQVIQSWQVTRFGFRDQSPLERVESMNVAAMRAKPERGTMLPLSSPDDLLIDEKHDLLAVKVSTSWRELEHVAFVDLESECFTRELTTGLTLVMVGVTLSSTASAPWMLPTLIPQTERVEFDSDLDTDGMTHNWYSPDYFFMPFSLAEDGIDPHGFSGAPIFVNKEPGEEGLWIASPHVIGIVLRYFRKKKLIVAVKIQTVIELLKSDHSQCRSSSIS